MRLKPLYVDVTPYDYAIAVRRSITENPVAIAISRLVKRNVEVKYGKVHIGNRIYSLPKIAIWAIRDFNQGFQTPPISFKLDRSSYSVE